MLNLVKTDNKYLVFSEFLGMSILNNHDRKCKSTRILLETDQ